MPYVQFGAKMKKWHAFEKNAQIEKDLKNKKKRKGQHLAQGCAEAYWAEPSATVATVTDRGVPLAVSHRKGKKGGG